MSQRVDEPRVVVENREDLWWLLAEASQLEHMIMCQYLFAEFSLKDGAREGLTPEQAEAVERWRKLLRGIAVEEMLHLALVSNVMGAIGAAPTFGRPNFPQRSGYFPSSIQLDLLPFGERALLHFLYLERPEGMERQDAEGFVPAAPVREPLEEQEPMPRGQEFLTVGHLYRGLEDGLRLLTDRLGERALFVGSPRAQATPELLQWPQLIAVTGLDSALTAVAEIIEQGEGARGNWRDAHYGRFLRIWEEYHALRERDPSFEPARPVLASYARQPYDIDTPLPVITDPLTRQVAELTNVAYEIVLQLLTRFFTHTDETDEQLETLINGAIGVMADVVRPLGTAMTHLPVGAEHDGRTAGFAFEMYYRMTNFVPWREPAWALLFERTSLLADMCGAGDVADVVGDAAGRAQSIAGDLAAHVPSELRRSAT
jgi:Ferritin-like